jgi:hypothetical protein
VLQHRRGVRRTRRRSAHQMTTPVAAAGLLRSSRSRACSRFLGTVGVLYAGSLVWLNWLENPVIFAVAAGSFGIGACQFISTTWLRVLVGLAGTAVAVACVLIGAVWMAIVGPPMFAVASGVAPGDSDYKAIVIERPDFMDTVWYVSIRQTRGLLSREWPAGCISNDPTSDPSIEQVIWQSPRRLLVSTGNADVVIHVNPRTGKPESPIPHASRVSC